MSRYRKTFAAFVAFAASGSALLADGDVSSADKVALAAGLVGVFAVWATPNKTAG